MKSIDQMLAELPSVIPPEWLSMPDNMVTDEMAFIEGAKRIDRLTAELAVHKAAAEKWNQHLWHCDGWLGEDFVPCTCGYDDMRKVLEKLK